MDGWTRVSAWQFTNVRTYLAALLQLALVHPEEAAFSDEVVRREMVCGRGELAERECLPRDGLPQRRVVGGRSFGRLVRCVD